MYVSCTHHVHNHHRDLHIGLPLKEQGHQTLDVTHFVDNLRTTFRNLRAKLHHMSAIQSKLLQDIFLEFGYFLFELHDLRLALFVLLGQISGMGEYCTRKDGFANLRRPQPSF